MPLNSLPPPLPDANTGKPQTGRYINQQTGDYVMQADGRLQGMDTVPQLVLIAIRNGIDLSTLTEKGADFPLTLATLVQNALADLIRRKLVRLDRVQVTDGSQSPGLNPDAAIAIAYWYDLTAGQPRQTSIA